MTRTERFELAIVTLTQVLGLLTVAMAVHSIALMH